MRPLVVGVGNPQRGDDAIGPIAAERLSAQRGGPFDIEILGGDCSALVDRLAERTMVIVVDACSAGAAPGTLFRFDAAEAPLPAYAGGMSTHGFGVAEALALAASLDRQPDRCVVFAVEGADFTLGSGMSPPVAAAVDRVIEAVIDELTSWNVDPLTVARRG